MNNIDTNGVVKFKENEIMNSLLGECLAYIKYGQDIDPIRVEDMLKNAFEAGKNERLDFLIE